MTITNTPSVETQQILQVHWNDLNVVMVEWRRLQDELVKLVALERRYRTAIYEMKFPTCEEGTNRVDLGNGYSLKCTAKFNYVLNNKDKATELALDELEGAGNEGQFIAERLVRWSPELSVKEYRSLAPQYKAIIDKVLTIKPGLPTLEIEPPKGA